MAMNANCRTTNIMVSFLKLRRALGRALGRVRSIIVIAKREKRATGLAPNSQETKLFNTCNYEWKGAQQCAPKFVCDGRNYLHGVGAVRLTLQSCDILARRIDTVPPLEKTFEFFFDLRQLEKHLCMESIIRSNIPTRWSAIIQSHHIP